MSVDTKLLIVGKELLPEGQEENGILEIIKENDLKNYKISASPGSKIGDNFTGAIVAIDIVGEKNSTGEHTELHLILKHSHRSGMFVDYIPSTKIFNHEIHMYRKYLTKLYELQKQTEIKSNGFLPVATIYKYSNTKGDEYIIMENMKKHGFVMLNRKVALDMNHCRLVLIQLGYFHALSYALKEREPETYATLTMDMKNHPMTMMQDPSFKVMLEKFIDIACTTIDPVKEKDLFDKTYRLKEYGFQTYFNDFMNSDYFDPKYTIMIHGDCWNNNILYKYDDSNKLTELCFLDWQQSRVASPVIDLMYFMCVCLSPEILENNFDDLIQIYYNALTEMLAKFELKAETILPFSALQDQLEQYGGCGAMFAVSTLPTFTCESEELPDFKEIEKLGDINLGELNVPMKNEDIYAKRIRGVLSFAVARKFIK